MTKENFYEKALSIIKADPDFFEYVEDESYYEESHGILVGFTKPTGFIDGLEKYFNERELNERLFIHPCDGPKRKYNYYYISYNDE